MHTVIGCLYVRTTLTSVVFALCRWPVHTNTHGEYKSGLGRGGRETERRIHRCAHACVSRYRAVSFHPTRNRNESPSFARAAITFFFSSEFSRPSGSIIRTEDLKILEFWNFRVSKAGVVSIFDFNSSERISLRVSLIEVKTMVEDSITKAKIR